MSTSIAKISAKVAEVNAQLVGSMESALADGVDTAQDAYEAAENGNAASLQSVAGLVAASTASYEADLELHTNNMNQIIADLIDDGDPADMDSLKDLVDKVNSTSSLGESDVPPSLFKAMLTDFQDVADTQLALLKSTIGDLEEAKSVFADYGDNWFTSAGATFPGEQV